MIWNAGYEKQALHRDYGSAGDWRDGQYRDLEVRERIFILPVET